MKKDILEIYNQYLKLSLDDSFDFEKFNQYAIVHHSNSIEGSTLTKEETFLLLDEKLTPKNKPLEHTLMALDHFEALKYVMNLSKAKKMISEKTLQYISSLIMKNTGSEISAFAGNFDSSKGEYRKVTVRAGTTTFIDYKKVPQRVKELLNYLNENIEKVKSFEEVNNLAFDVYFQLVSIHPFADGNGRISRLLMNYVQQYHKMPLTSIYIENKIDYFESLQETREKQDITVFRKFMFYQTRKNMLERIEQLSSKQTIKKTKGGGLSFIF